MATKTKKRSGKKSEIKTLVVDFFNNHNKESFNYKQVVEIEQSIVMKKKELEDLKKQFDVYKAKMESLLISQLELLKEVNKDNN